VKNRLLLILILILVFGAAAFAENFVVADPMHIGVGARPLGMGKAYVAVAEDGDTVFVNPAGLGYINHPKITSMYSNVMGDVSYMVLGGAYPTSPNSAVGAGAIVSNTAGIPIYSSIDPGSATGATGQGSWGSSVMFASYGMSIPDAKLSFGGSVKMLNQGGSGNASIEAASASGMSFDVGALYKPTDNITLGISAQNPLGAKVESGVSNSLPSVIKVGGKYTITPYENGKINLAADVDVVKNRPTTMHLGGEYYLTPNLALRAGIDQDPVGTQVESNPTLGLGVRTNGIEFNYAYHPYLSQISDNATHYFSISYVGPDKPKDESDLDIAILKPADKSVIYADNVDVSGTVKGGKAMSLKINGANVPFDQKSGTFTANLPIDKVGKKLLVIEAVKADGKSSKAQVRILRLVQFADVNNNYWAKNPIEHTGTVGLVQGYPDGTFKPEKSLTRAELATLLVRAEGVKVSGRAPQIFKDVKVSHWAAGYVEAAYRMGLIKGYPDGKFRPNNKINKAESVAVLVRYDKLNLAAVENKPYADVATKHWAAKYIQAAKEAGMLNYIQGARIRPKEEVNRAEAVEMMSKTSVAIRMINDLLSWDKGFEFELSRPTIRAGL
jgi:hypothetical protein